MTRLLRPSEGSPQSITQFTIIQPHILCAFFILFFFFNDTATTEIFPLSLQRRSSDLLGCQELRRCCGPVGLATVGQSGGDHGSRPKDILLPTEPTGSPLLGSFHRPARLKHVH